MNDEIIEHLSQLDLDIRKSGDARFMDQKCTPDVVCFISDCIINTIQVGRAFKVKDIWESAYFKKNVRAIFGKPWSDDPKARSEFDKFVQQPMRMLAYARVLVMERVRVTNVYFIANREILDYIAQRERNSFVFLDCYLTKVLSDSELLRYFNEYASRAKAGTLTQEDFANLKDRFTKFIIGNTKINGKLEVHRIFPKILNVFAVDLGMPGAEKGKMSPHAFTFADLMYNRKNWRDLRKAKTQTRQAAEEELQGVTEQQLAYNEYNIKKAIAIIRRIHPESEVHDSLAVGEATQVHHIFSKSAFPQIAHYVENLIKLTPAQHFTRAHPNNNTQIGTHSNLVRAWRKQ